MNGKDAANPVLSHWWAWVGLLSLVALGLRFLAIDRHSIWHDEAVTAVLSQASFADLIIGRARDNGNPPLYWLLSRLWSLAFGDSPTALRSLPALCGVATVPLIAGLGRRLLGPTVGLI